MSQPVSVSDDEDRQGATSHTDRKARSRSHTISYPSGPGTDHAEPPDAASAAPRSSLIASALGGLLGGFSPTRSTMATMTTTTNCNTAGMAHSPASSISSDDSIESPNTPQDASPILKKLSLSKTAVVEGGAEYGEAPFKFDRYPISPSSTIASRRGAGVMGTRRSSWAQPTSPGLSRWLNLQSEDQSKGGANGGGIASQPALGVFRRMSIGSGPKYAVGPAQPQSPTKPAKESAPLATTDDAEERQGRGLARRGSSPRKLSPMSERMLRGHYHM